MLHWGLDNDFSVAKRYFVNGHVLHLGLATSMFNVAASPCAMRWTWMELPERQADIPLVLDILHSLSSCEVSSQARYNFI